MTSRQRSLLFVLAIANAILLCCLAPAVFILATQPPDQNPLQPALDALQIALPSPSPPAALQPTLEAGWKLYTVSTDNFAIALPSTWKQVPLSQADIAAEIDALGKKNPEFGNAPGAQSSSVALLVRFVGIDTAPEGTVGAFSTNIDVFHRTQLIDAPLDVYIPISLKALQDLPYASKPIFHRRVQTLAGDAEEFRYHNTLKLPNDQEVTTANREYILVHDKEFFVITCTAPLKQEDRYAPIFERIAASFRWMGN